MKKTEWRGLAIGALLAFPTHVVGQAPSVPQATDITAQEIDAVRAVLGSSIDQQIKVADVGHGNIAVGVLHRVALEDQGDTPRGLVHTEVTEVYYVLSGGGTLVTGGSPTVSRHLPAEGPAVSTLVGPSFLGTSEGGHVRQVAEGDIVVIPSGLFHAWAEIPDHVTYLSIRPDPGAVLPAGYTHPALTPPGR